MKLSHFKLNFFLPFILAFSFSNLNAAATYDCTSPELIANIDGTTVDANASYSENSSAAQGYTRYFKFNTDVNGILLFSIEKNSLTQIISIGTSCGGDDIYAGADSDEDQSDSVSITSNTDYYIMVEEKNAGQDLIFTLNLNFMTPATIGFEQASYEVLEDVNTADGSTKLMPIKIILSKPVSQDVSIDYTTTDGSAIGGSDYVTYTNKTATINAGETEVTIYMDIIHDVPIEFDENFNLTLSSLSVTDGSVEIGTNSSAEVTILEQVNIPICYEDDFETALDDDWRTLFSSGGFTPQIVDGRLRLTSASTNLATAVTKDYEFKSNENIIIVEFEQYAYGGCGDAHDGLGTYGADGIVAVLYDSAVGETPTPGAFGGSMGYAQKDSQDGFEGGWLGLGIDEYGNYANPTEGRIGGIGFTPNYVSIRGDGNGTSGYEFLASSSELNPPVAVKNTDTAEPRHKYRFTADARDPDHLYITLERDIYDGNGYQVIINKFDAKDGANGQSTTPEYVRFAFTAGTGGGCNNHEIDELKVQGICRAYAPNPPEVSATNADIVNDFTSTADYNAGTKFITTKVSNKPETITGVHLDGSGDAASYTSVDTNLKFRIIPYISDSNCSTKDVLYDTNGNPAVITISNGQVTSNLDVVMPSYANQDTRFYITSMDFSQIYENATVNAICLKNSSEDGNLQGVAQCLNSETTYLNIFGQDTYDRCFAGNGSPCLSQNGGQSCGQEQQTTDFTQEIQDSCGYNPSYGDDYGCLMCTLDSADSGCSSDNFAIRPDKFNIEFTDADVPDLMRSGSTYNATVTASNYGSSTQTLNYNQSKANLTLSESVVNSADGSATVLNGSASLSSESVFSILNGISTDGSVSYEVVGMEFDDVGKVTLILKDKNWARVDLEDDRSMNDPSSTLYNNCNSDGAYICGDLNVTFIPHHFSLEDINMTNNNGSPGTFTYISNIDDANISTFDMAARVEVTVVAENENNNATLNFTNGAAYYENPVGANISLTHANHGDSNTTTIPDAKLGFAGGQYTVTWNENNTSKVLRFNFPRRVDTSVNPFTVSASGLTINVKSTYSGTDITGQDIGTGSGGATFLYGRTNAERQTFQGDSGNSFIYFESFCNGTDSLGVTCNKTLLPNNANLNSTNDPRWYINTAHTVNDGVVGNINQKNASKVSNTAIVNGVPTQVTLEYDESSGYPYKATMENNASRWLIYNKYDNSDTKNEFEVEFIKNNSDWAGVDEANSTSKTDGAIKTNRRIMW
ncbi:Calx-beta domain-containing protein [Sulfurimonas sp.]|uniref:Calx-beta domain-containing protein n=1 Tax=Sulfurimonas sp. TaxID=2022749 RepID=UPI00356228CF